MPTRKRYSRTRSTKKRSLAKNKISLSVNLQDSDGGFHVFSSKRVKDFVLENIKNGNNLIQTQHNKPFFANKKTVIHLQAAKYNSFNLTPTWEEIKCKSSTDWLKSSPCEIGKTNKVFVKYKSNGNVAGFGAYLIQIITGVVDKNMHRQFINVLKKTMKGQPIIIHNEDVDWFHLKGQ